MDYSDKISNPFIQDIIFTKNSIKDLEDSIYIYYPKKYYDVLPLLHKAYDSIALTLYRLNKCNWYTKNTKTTLELIFNDSIYKFIIILSCSF